MNFFEDQRLARKRSSRLLTLFYFVVFAVSAICGTIAAMYANNAHRGRGDLYFHSLDLSISKSVFIWFAAVTTLIAALILIKTWFEVRSLKKDPSQVCKSLGARKVLHNSRDFYEKQYINIVEEMSIASSVPVPEIYVLEDNAINAFACGFDINSAAVCVTSGCMQKLTRDELQAVVAHEYSHIFNGDMKLNLKLLGMLAGLILIFKIGVNLMRSSGRSSRRDSKGGSLAPLGLGLMAIGGLGYLGGIVLKAAISRQREFLADASSVQYTRNPEGIAGALKKIYINHSQGIIHAKNATQASHMFLVEGVKSFFSLSTHPPIFERIKAVDKNFDEKRFLKEDAASLMQEMTELQKSEKSNTRSQDERMRDAREKLLKIAPLFLLYQSQNNYLGLVQTLLRRGNDDFGHLSEEELETALEKASGELKELPQTERQKILQEIIKEVNADGKISFYEFLVVAYLKPSLEPVKVEDKKLSSGQVKDFSLVLKSFFYYLDDNADLKVNFSLIEKNKLGYGKILSAIEGYRFSTPKQKELILKELKEIATLNGFISKKERITFKLFCHMLGVPGFVLDD